MVPQTIRIYKLIKADTQYIRNYRMHGKAQRLARPAMPWHWSPVSSEPVALLVER